MIGVIVAELRNSCYFMDQELRCNSYRDSSFKHCKKTESHPAHKSVNVAWARTQSAWTLSTATCGRQYPSKSLWMSPLQATFHSQSLYMVLELSRMWIKQAICGQYWAILSLFRKDPVRISGGTKKVKFFLFNEEWVCIQIYQRLFLLIKSCYIK